MNQDVIQSALQVECSARQRLAISRDEFLSLFLLFQRPGLAIESVSELGNVPSRLALHPCDITIRSSGPDGRKECNYA